MPRLDFYNEGDLFVQVNVEERPISFGRSSECDVVLSDPTVSRVHAEIHHRNMDYFLLDLSKNGTRLNSTLLTATEKAMSYGDRIYIGPYTIVFQKDGAPVNLGTTHTTIIDAAPVSKVK